MSFWPEIMMPEDVEAQIATPHQHEDVEHNPPAWLVWKIERVARDGIPYWPQLDTVCNSEEMARAHVLMVLAEDQSGRRLEKVWVERVPMNHRFASSLGDWQHRIHVLAWKERMRRLDGD